MNQAPPSVTSDDAPAGAGATGAGDAPALEQQGRRWNWLLPLQILLVLACLCAVVWLPALQSIAKDSAQALTAQRNDISNLGRLSVENAERTLESVDLTLRTVRHEYSDHQGRYNLQTWNQDQLFDKQLITQIAVLDAHGLLQNSTLPFKAPVNLSDRADFKAHLGAVADTLYISKPVLERVSGKWTVQFSRRINRRDGSFFGVVVASVDPGYFTRFYSALELGNGGASAMSYVDGSILATKVDGPDEFQGQLPFSEMVNHLDAGETQVGFLVNTDNQQGERIFHFRRLPNFPLVVTFSQPTALALQRMQASRQALLSEATLVTLLLILGAVALWYFVAKRQALQAHLSELRQLSMQADASLADERQDRERTREARHEWIRLQSAALEACTTAIWIGDINGVIRWANPAFTELSGYALDEIVGRRPQDLVSSGAQEPQFYTTLWRTVLDGKPWRGELVNCHKDGRHYDEAMSITPVTNAQGTITHFIVVKEDITLRKRIVAEAHAANQAKSQFLANMSHEIRTPMNGVVGMVDILQATELNPAQKRMLGTVHKSALALLSILNDILDYSKIESGMLTVERIPMHVRDVTESVAQLMAVAASAVRVEMLVFVSPELPPWVISDPTRLRQVLLNLVGNAIKFTKTGEAGVAARVMLLVEACAGECQKPGLQIRVIDNGIGMSAQLLGDLFKPFTQADASTARRFGGTGLGLSISQRLVTLMGGTISVQSTQGVGSEFCIVLPLQLAVAPRMQVFGPQLQDVQVLVLVKDEPLRRIVAAYAAETQASVLLLPDLDALQQLAAAPPSAVPTVLVLGPEYALQAVKPSAALSLVRLSRSNAPQDAGDELTVTAFPLIFSDYVRALALASRRLTPSPALEQLQQGAPHTPAVPSVEVAAQQQQLVLLADDNEVNRTVIQEQLRLLGYASEIAEDGQIALALWRNGRYALLLTDCHMPNMDGFALTEAIRREEPPDTHLPIVAITANAMQGEAQRCLEHGMDDYLAKPLRMLELAPMLHKWLPLSAPGSTALLLPLAPAVLPAAQSAVWDVDMLGQMVGDDAAMQQRLLNMFLRNAETQIATICVCTAVGRLQEAADHAHSLKSAGRMVGAMAFGALCEEIECAGLAGDTAACHALAQGLDAQLADVQAAVQARASAATV